MKKKWLVALSLLLAAGIFGSGSVWAGIFDWPYNVDSFSGQEVSLAVPAGAELPLTADVLERELSLQKGELGGITITKLPSESGGVLRLNGSPVTPYQALTREELQHFSFTASPDNVHAEFGLVLDLPTSLPAVLNIHSQTDPRIISCEGGEVLTKEDIAVYGQVAIANQLEQRYTVQIAEKPKKGNLYVNGLQYCYTPYPGKRGEDSFSVVAVDDAGNRSEKADFSVNIEQKINGYDYWDLNDSPAYYSAVKLLENGIFEGEQIGSRRYFSPRKTVSRGEFLMMLLSTVGLDSELSQTSINTGLKNDADIPIYLKPYVVVAKEHGILPEDVFHPDEIPMLAEAVVMIDRACKIPPVSRANPQWGDLAEIPNWALQSYMNLDAYHLLSPIDGNAHSLDSLTRERLADLLWQCRLYQLTAK